jgi:hypothetical protein
MKNVDFYLGGVQMNCSACFAVLPTGANFCLACGNKVKEQSQDEKISIEKLWPAILAYNAEIMIKYCQNAGETLFKPERNYCCNKSPFRWIFTHINIDTATLIIGNIRGQQNIYDIVEMNSSLVDTLNELVNSASKDNINRLTFYKIYKLLVDSFESLRSPLIINEQLMMVSCTDLEMFAKYLLSVGANVEFAQNEFFPLYGAATLGRLSVAKVLIEHGANINRQTPEEGNTALMVAAHNGHMAIVKLLLDSGANVNIEKNTFLPPKTAYECAKVGGYPQIAKVIKQYGASTSLLRNLWISS